MAETAALLVEHRLPAVPWRQWVLSFPGPRAVRLGYDRALLARVRQRFAARVMQTLRRQSKREHGLTSSAVLHPGLFIVVQRFRNDLGLFVHLHALVTDGCFEASVDGEPRFRPVEGLSEGHLVRTLQRLHADISTDCDHDEGGDGSVDEAMTACVQLALPLRAPASTPMCEPPSASPLLVTGSGMQLHAAVTVDGRDRTRLERLCRYMLRPPFALDAIERTTDGQVRVHFKKPNRFGATYAQMPPDTFIETISRVACDRASIGNSASTVLENRNAALLALLTGVQNGLSARDIAEETGASLPQIRSAIVRLGKKVRFKGNTAARRY